MFCSKHKYKAQFLEKQIGEREHEISSLRSELERANQEKLSTQSQFQGM